MSLGYAEKLSYREHVGTVGMPERLDSPEAFEAKIHKLVDLISQNSGKVVAFTGAGISTASGIPDFRGPRGIWTLQRNGEPLPQCSVPFAAAAPSFTHMALLALLRAGVLRFIISQNVDGLHLRSGVPRERLAELHGNSFMEKCSRCDTEYMRDFEVESVGLKRTGRKCTRITQLEEEERVERAQKGHQGKVTGPCVPKRREDRERKGGVEKRRPGRQREGTDGRMEEEEMEQLEEETEENLEEEKGRDGGREESTAGKRKWHGKRQRQATAAGGVAAADSSGLGEQSHASLFPLSTEESFAFGLWSRPGAKGGSRRIRHCNGWLKDTVLDWEDPLPPKELEAAERECKEAGLLLCLGTSLQITPCCNLPLKTLRAGGKYAIVNLQATPKDSKAALTIASRVDKVMALVVLRLGLPVPPYVHETSFLLVHRWRTEVGKVERVKGARSSRKSNDVHATGPDCVSLTSSTKLITSASCVTNAISKAACGAPQWLPSSQSRGGECSGVLFSLGSSEDSPPDMCQWGRKDQPRSPTSQVGSSAQGDRVAALQCEEEAKGDLEGSKGLVRTGEEGAVRRAAESKVSGVLDSDSGMAPVRTSQGKQGRQCSVPVEKYPFGLGEAVRLMPSSCSSNLLVSSSSCLASIQGKLKAHMQQQQQVQQVQQVKSGGEAAEVQRQGNVKGETGEWEMAAMSVVDGAAAVEAGPQDRREQERGGQVLSLAIHSIHGPKCPLPFIHSLELSFPTLCAQGPLRWDPPFQPITLSSTTEEVNMPSSASPLPVHLLVHLAQGTQRNRAEAVYSIPRPDSGTQGKSLNSVTVQALPCVSCCCQECFGCRLLPGSHGARSRAAGEKNLLAPGSDKSGQDQGLDSTNSAVPGDRLDVGPPMDDSVEESQEVSGRCSGHICLWGQWGEHQAQEGAVGECLPLKLVMEDLHARAEQKVWAPKEGGGWGVSCIRVSLSSKQYSPQETLEAGLLKEREDREGFMTLKPDSRSARSGARKDKNDTSRGKQS